MDVLDLEQARGAIDRAVALAPHEARFFNNRGNALLALERPQAALDSYDQALKLAPDFLDPLTNRGLALQALGHSARPFGDEATWAGHHALAHHLDTA